MKQIIYTIMLYCSLSLAIFSQPMGNLDNPNRGYKKLQILEKVRLIEELNLDEKQSEVFFARKQAYENKMRQLRDKRDEMINRLSKIVDENSIDKSQKIKSLTKDIYDIEKQIVSERQNFLTSIEEVLNEEQIAKLLIFEVTFRREMHEVLKKRFEKIDRKK